MSTSRSRYRTCDTGRGGPVTALTNAQDLILGFTDRYANPTTRQHYGSEIRELFTGTGRRHPAELTETDVLRWCAGLRRPAANDTVRNRLSLAATFMRWCVREGHAGPAVLDALTDRDNPLRRVPRLYGKVQSKHPARWLTHDEAFGRLLGVCAGDGEVDLRDELVLRLGLAGLRAAVSRSRWPIGVAPTCPPGSAMSPA